MRWYRQKMRHVIETERLRLRAATAADAAAVQSLAGDWAVARMLADMPFPLTLADARTWLDRESGDEVFAIEFTGRLAGAVTLAAAAPGEAELGFWIGRPWWGRGLAREAVTAIIAHGFARRRLAAITSGHFADNAGSERVLASLGFAPISRSTIWCEARREAVAAVHYRLESPQAIAEARRAVVLESRPVT
jgi:RimJ/RimL family protein N-acetyltransferase